MIKWIQQKASWSTARKIYITGHPFCEICGYMPTSKLSLPNDVHHIVPRHVDPSLTTDQSNLITLCRKYDCHLRFGHFGDYRRCWNSEVRNMFQNSGQTMMEAERSFREINAINAKTIVSNNLFVWISNLFCKMLRLIRG